ncbi:hypothetical protein J7E83_06885 [Arthrobacter sp. ISL-48]|uniref:hypothetical protein n=1 Tax=Arthrobacter sp. ISL-48 TaxID=2819110 RepID=UPI001BE7DAB6|nr:hypothetical protein [Arthrobacter sp. ISL-48]MBT2531851.1 hypothetical protein [Arthrobacter sp. ISL-48]
MAIVSSLIVLLRMNGQLEGIPAMTLAALLVLLVPTARNLSLRLLINGLLAMGFTPLTWWIPERIIGIDHGTLLLAACSGLVSWWIFSAKRVAPRLRRLLPIARWIDAVPFLAGVLSAMSVGTMLAVRTSLDALSIMTSRWDYQSHFSIYYMVRSHGEVIPTIPLPPNGAPWGFSEYPQGFHALLATLSELVRPVQTSIDAELVSYINLQALVSVLTVFLVMAALCALPSVRRNPAVMAPAIAVAAGAWIFGPGSIPVYDGFANFYLACGLATATVLLILVFHRRMPIWGLAAVGAGIIGTANNWLLLLTLIAVVFIAKLWSVLRRSGTYGRSWWRLAFVVAAFTLLGVSLPVLQISPLIDQGQEILGLAGGISVPDFGLTLASVVLVVTLGFANAALRVTRPPLQDERQAVKMACFGLFLPIGLCLWLAISQSITNGAISYYFYKYLVAVLLFALPVAVAATASLLPRPRHSGLVVTGRNSLTASLCLLSLSATQFFGFSVSGLDEIGLPPTARAVTEMEEQTARLKVTPDYVARLLVSAVQPQPAETVYIAAPSTIDAVLAARWQWGMRGRSSLKTTGLSPLLAEIIDDYNHAPEFIAQILTEDPTMSVIVDPELYETVRRHLVTLGLEGRLLKLAVSTKPRV